MAEALLYHKIYLLGSHKPWVVFVHGAGGSSSIWFKQIREYRKHFNLLLVDLRGHGKSKEVSKKYNQYTFKDIAKELLLVVDHVGVEKATYVGISLGTVIIRALGELAPTRIESMVLGGAIVRLNFRGKFLAGLGNMFKTVMPYMWLYRFFAFIIMPSSRHKESRNMFINEARKLYQKEFLRWYRLTYEINPLLRYFKENELLIPTLYLMGDEDHMFLPQVQNLIKHHTMSQLVVIPNSGHVCNIDQPELFNAASIAFIKKQFV